MDKEREELYKALGYLTTLHPTMEIDIDNPFSMAEQIYEHVSKTNFQRVREFMSVGGQALPENPNFPDDEVIDLRENLIEEELTEFYEAVEKKDIVGVADALADLLYVVYGAGIAFGINLDEVFREVHDSNMSKVVNGNFQYREDGKILKPDSYRPPNVEKVLFGD